MPEVEILHEKFKCIGCATCTALNPKYWVMEGMKAELVGSEKKEGEIETLTQIMDEQDFELNKQADESCPVNCIHVKKKE